MAVYEQNLAPGRGGIIYPEVTEALYHSPNRPEVIQSFIGGLGGTQLGLGETRMMLKKCREPRTVRGPRDPILLFRKDDSERLDQALRLAGVVRRKPERGNRNAG